MVCGVNARQRWKQVQTIQIMVYVLLESRNTNEMVCGVNAMQRLKKVRMLGIQITIVFESRIQIRWFVELLLGNVGNKFEPFK